MELTQIDPERYRKRLNKVIFASIAILTLGSLGISQLLILLMPSGEGSHFHWNLLGVIISCLILGYLLTRFKTHTFLYEISYVWDLKKQLNLINRRIRKLESAAQNADATAMQILHFSYSGSRQLWELDNNTITINHLTHLENKLHELADSHQIQLDASLYNSKQLKDY